MNVAGPSSTKNFYSTNWISNSPCSNLQLTKEFTPWSREANRPFKQISILCSPHVLSNWTRVRSILPTPSLNLLNIYFFINSSTSFFFFQVDFFAKIFRPKFCIYFPRLALVPLVEIVSFSFISFLIYFHKEYKLWLLSLCDFLSFQLPFGS